MLWHYEYHIPAWKESGSRIGGEPLTKSRKDGKVAKKLCIPF
jgi:hypothetical protein